MSRSCRLGVGSGKEFREANPDVKAVWSSPEFCHCTFTAPKTFDKLLSAQFTRLITDMDSNDPLVAELNRLENTTKWVESETDGYEALYDALEQKLQQQSE